MFFKKKKAKENRSEGQGLEEQSPEKQHLEKQSPEEQNPDNLEQNTAMKSSQIEVPDLKEKIVEALKTVYDPEIPVDIYELGLIYEIKVFPVNNVYILMTLTTPNCPSAEELPGEVKAKALSVEGVNDVELDLTFEPPYHQDMMSEAAKLELGFL